MDGLSSCEIVDDNSVTNYKMFLSNMSNMHLLFYAIHRSISIPSILKVNVNISHVPISKILVIFPFNDTNNITPMHCATYVTSIKSISENSHHSLHLVQRVIIPLTKRDLLSALTNPSSRKKKLIYLLV